MTRSLAAALTLVLGLQTGSILLAQGRRGPLVLLSRDGRRDLASTTVNGREMVSLADISASFPLTFREDAAAGGLTISFGTRSAVLSLTQGLASVQGRLISLPAPPVRTSQTWLVPVEFLTQAMPLLTEQPIDFHRSSGLLVVGNLRVPQVVVRHETSTSSPTLTFGITPRTPHTVSQEGTRILIRFEADALDADIVPSPAPDFVQSVRVLDQATAIAIEITRRVSSFKANDQPVGDSSTRLVIELVPAATETTAATPDAAGTPSSPIPAPSTPLPAFEPPAAFQTVVIDAGHGGEEEGTKGANGTLEKNVTLVVARRLKSALESRLGLRVIMTRDADTLINLDERAAVANNNKADLFVSFHANASLRPLASGAEVFYLSLADYGTTGLRPAGEAAPSLPLVSGGTREIEMIRWEMAQARHIDDSSLLAQMVEEQLRARVPMSGRPIQQAPFRVLVGANMPAVLIEMGYLSNPDDEKRLVGGAFQGEIVEALFASIVRFRTYRETQRNTPTLPTAPPPSAIQPAPLPLSPSSTPVPHFDRQSFQQRRSDSYGAEITSGRQIK